MDIFDRDYRAAASLVSLEGALAFGRQVLWALFMAGAGTWFVMGEVEGLRGMLWAVLAMVCAYVFQTLDAAGLWRWVRHVLLALSWAFAAMSFLCAAYILTVWVP